MKTQKLFAIMAILCLFVITLSGCGWLDSVFLPKVAPDGSVVPSLADGLGNAARDLIPGWGAVAGFALSGFGWLWQAIRGKKRESLLPAFILDLIKAVIAAKDGKLDMNQLYSMIPNASKLFANKDKFVALVVHVKSAVDKELADGFQVSDIPKIIAEVEKDVEDIKDLPRA